MKDITKEILNTAFTGAVFNGKYYSVRELRESDIDIIINPATGVGCASEAPSSMYSVRDLNNGEGPEPVSEWVVEGSMTGIKSGDWKQNQYNIIDFDASTTPKTIVVGVEGISTWFGISITDTENTKIYKNGIECDYDSHFPTSARSIDGQALFENIIEVKTPEGIEIMNVVCVEP